MNILLCCAVGMSTSMLVRRMEKAAAEQNLTDNISAVPVDVVQRYINETDVLLIGPHLKYLEDHFKEMVKEKGIPVNVIDTVDYGTFNGENVLKLAHQLYEENN